MDKCKYYLNINGVQKVFYSDQELSDFVRNKIDFNGDNIKVKFSLDENSSQQDKTLDDLTQDKIDSYLQSSPLAIEFVRREHMIDGKNRHLVE